MAVELAELGVELQPGGPVVEPEQDVFQSVDEIGLHPVVKPPREQAVVLAQEGAEGDADDDVVQDEPDAVVKSEEQ